MTIRRAIASALVAIAVLVNVVVLQKEISIVTICLLVAGDIQVARLAIKVATR